MTVSLFFYSTECNGDYDGAVLIVIGYPSSGKSETVNTLTNKRDFRTVLQSTVPNEQQKSTYFVSDLQITVRDTTSFENVNEFVAIYNSLRDLESQKVVFGLTIGIGRLDSEFTDTLQNLFKEHGIGEHLKRRTFIIFTKKDELLKYDEVSYGNKFEKWLKNAEELYKLITSLQLRYCVIENKKSGDKRTQQAALVVKRLQYILQNGNEQERWYNGNENVNSNNSEFPTSENDCTEPDTVSKEDIFDKQIMNKEFTITLRRAIYWVDKLQEQHKSYDRIITINKLLLEFKIESESTRSTENASKLLCEFEKRSRKTCSPFAKCEIL